MNKPHLTLAHQYWTAIVNQGDLIIDATCGNGHDSHVLAKLSNRLISIDIQEQAILKTKELLASKLTPKEYDSIHFILGSHECFPPEILPEAVTLIVYNLGYLPGGDKTKTTQHDSTVNSLRNALGLLKSGGMISITCYPGHPEGKIEEKAVLDFTEFLDSKKWNCCHHRWLNRKDSPSLLIIKRTEGR